MRIEGAPYLVDLSRPQAVPSQGSQTAAVQGSAGPARVRSLDRVEISPKARELQKLKQELSALPDVRLDRVAVAKQQLQQGGRVDSTLLAQKMLASPGNG